MKRLSLLCLVALSFPLFSCGTDIYDVVDEGVQPPKNEAKHSEVPKPLLNFLGDSIFDYWKNLSNYFPDYNCQNYGWSAKGIDTFLGRVDITTLAGTDCVVEIGTNDMKRVMDGGDIDGYVKHYIEVLSSLKAKRIYLLSLLPRNREKDASYDLNSIIPTVNALIQDLAESQLEGLVYIPLYDLFYKDGQINWAYTYDGLHPNSAGYQILAEEIKKYLEPIQ